MFIEGGVGGRQGLAVVTRRQRSPLGGRAGALWSHSGEGPIGCFSAQLGSFKVVTDKPVSAT